MSGATTDKYERIVYAGVRNNDEFNVNGRVRVNALGGDDEFYSDDTSTMITLDGGAGEDLFQIGQMFGSDRVSPNVLLGDEIETNETTQGFLSVGNSHPMIVYGGTENDTFNVYSNKGLTKLFGEDGNDLFVVRAFVLADDETKTAGGGDAEAFGGDGDDSFLYNINAPLAIDGGSGTDTIVVLGTERADSFLITEQGIFGAGLNISFEGVEKAEIDGLEGDDTFYVQSTAANMAVTVIGGLGSDFISIGGDVTNDIVSLEVEGSSGIVNHAVNSLDPAFNGNFVDGLRLNVANENSGLFEINSSGLDILNEGGTEGYYEIRMTQAIAATAYLTVSASRSSTQDRNLAGVVKANSALVSTSSGSGYESAKVLTFTNTTAWQRVYVQAPQDDAAEGTRGVVVSHQALAASGTDAATATKINTTKVANVEVTVFDDDAYGVRVAGNPSSIDIAEGAAGKTLTLTLSREPDATEEIFYDIEYPNTDYTVTSTNTTFTEVVDGKLRVKFTAANYATGVEVTVAAIEDMIEENRERQPLTITLNTTETTQATWVDLADPTEVDVRIFDNDKGEVLVAETDGDTIVSASSPDSYTLVLSKAPIADVVVSVLTDGQTIANSTDTRWNNTAKTVTFTAANWNQPITIDLTIGTVVTEPQPTIDPGAQNHLVSGIQGPLFVFGGVGAGADRAIAIAKTLPNELNTDLPNVTSPVNEDEQTDRLVVFNDGSGAIQSGTMTETNISGFDMGSIDLELNFGTAAVEDIRTFKAGINYEQFEVVELLLGSNNDTLTIESTALNALTVVHGGGGNDNISVVATSGTANAGGADRTLAIFGDTTQDGLRYNSRTGALDGSGREFPLGGGNDVIDVSKAGGFVMVYGGVGNDNITGSNFNDHLLGGSGDDTINGLGGNDHIYGDNGLNINQSVRLDQQPQLISIVIEQVGTANFNALTGDALLAPGADVISGSGNNVILTDFGLIEQIAGTNRAFDTGSIVNVQSQRETEGGADVVTMGEGVDVVIGGNGSDILNVGNGGSVIIGDNGQIDFDPATQGLDLIVSRSVENAGDDTITAGEGYDFVIGGTGSDSVTVGNGGSTILGDNGEIDIDIPTQVIDRIVSRSVENAGDDTISSGEGLDFVIGGTGSDSVTVGNGGSVILGDNGEITIDPTTRIVELIVSTAVENAGDDTISSGAGFDFVIGGTGADSINIGNDGGAILGDNGQIDIDPATGNLVEMATSDSAFGGSDSITAGDGSTFVFGGSAGDMITTAGGDDVIAGDQGHLTFLSGVRSLFESPIEDPAYGGDDTVSTGAGDDWVILGEGNDEALSDSGLNIVLGDAGRIEGEGTTGIYIRVETTQTGTGGNDSITGGSDRDIQMGGAGADLLIGNAGNDLMQGDNGLLTRLSPFATGERTFESTAITDGDNDTLIGDTLDDPNVGRDVMIGGIGNDSFSLGVGNDIVAGEFLRVRFIPTGNGRELVTSFLTPALRDLDLLVQITLGVNFSSGSSVIYGPPEGTNIEFGFPTDTRAAGFARMDLLFLDDDLLGDALMQGLLSEDGMRMVNGLTGFRLQSPEAILGGAQAALLDATNAATPSGEGEPADTGQGTAPEVQEDAALRALEAEFASARAAAAEDGSNGGWQLGGWRIGT